MGQYLKAAFLVGIPVPGLGRLPLNAMAVFAVVALGFVEPSIWLAGLGLEAAFVGSLAFNPRFQNVVNSLAIPSATKADADRRNQLIGALPADLKARLTALHTTSVRVLEIINKLAAEPETIAGTVASLDKLEWIYLKLLIARDHLANDLGSESHVNLAQRIDSLQKDLDPTSGNATQKLALQRSQQATLVILEQRLQNLDNRDLLLKENESDLSRIEAQVALMRENAAIEGKPISVDTEIEFASDLRSPDLFSVHGALVHDLDEARSR